MSLPLLHKAVVQVAGIGLAFALMSIGCRNPSASPSDAMAQQMAEAMMASTPEAMMDMPGEAMKTPEAMMGMTTEAMMAASPPPSAAFILIPTPATVPTPMPAATATSTAVPTPTPAPPPPPAVVLPNHLRSPHFVSSSPSHGQPLSQIPESIAINFDFVLHDGSAMTVTRDGASVQLTNRSIDASKLILRASIVGNPGGGVYVVNYKACWPDTSCHDGQFALVVHS